MKFLNSIFNYFACFCTYGFLLKRLVFTLIDSENETISQLMNIKHFETILNQCPVPTPPGSNKPAGLPEDTALLGKPRIPAAHPSPGSGTTVSGIGGLTTSGVNILASAELSKMFPTPPSHEHPMQSPCGQLEGSTDASGDLSSGSSGSQNGIKTEAGLNGCSPTYSQEDPNKVSH